MPASTADILAAPVVVAAGSVTALRLFEVANEIDLKQAEMLWRQQPRPASTRPRLTATPAKAMSFGVPPLELALEPVSLSIDGGLVPVGVTARVYDFGVISLALRAPAQGPWDAFVGQANAMARAAEAEEAPWGRLLEQLRRTIGPAMQRPVGLIIEEDYLLAVVNAFGERLTAAELQARVDLAQLLSGETAPLSDGARAEFLRARFSYYPNDLVALTWDRALIVEPRGDTDVADVLEVANAQLLEMRYYDELLDAELPRMYDLVASARGARNWVAARRYARLARLLYTLVAEVTELTEKVDNALQVTEDVYLARVYAAALDLFRVPRLSAAVDRKLSIIRDTYTALYDEASSGRTEVLEVAIIVLITLELVLAVIR
jgi:hypothetical protein